MFISRTISTATIAEAKRIRAERDARYGNIFEERDTDCRWVGEVGELFFDQFLTEQNIPHVWITNDTAGKADFIVNGHSVGVKTVKRRVAPRLYYTAQITARHSAEPVEQFFFASYEYPTATLWLLGGIRRDIFLDQATLYKAGDRVHANYSIREGHEIYNIPIRNLVTPAEWFQCVKDE